MPLGDWCQTLPSARLRRQAIRRHPLTLEHASAFPRFADATTGLPALRDPRSAFDTSLLVLRFAIVAGMLLAAPRAYAYSVGERFDAPPADPATNMYGGGGGRRFTGSPADGFTCDVCHISNEAPDWQISGLPRSGFSPGEDYTITVSWPEETNPTGLAAEFVTADGSPSGVVVLPARDRLEDVERCSSGEAATRSWPSRGDRTVLGTDACGATQVRFRWTAPSEPMETWFHAAIVQGDDSGTPEGDRFEAIRAALPAEGTPIPDTSVATGCHIERPGSSRPSPTWFWPWIACVFAALRVCIRRRS